MSLVPRTVTRKIEFFEAHLARWAEVATEIGSTPEEIASLEARVAAARAAYTEQYQIQQKARSATLKLRIALAKMSTEGGAVIARARAKAKGTGDRSVYVLASIPRPAKGSPLAQPGTPYAFEVQLFEGALKIAWKCDNPEGASGTIYEIYRSDRPHAPFDYLGNTGIRTFTDATIPAGASRITYKIRAARSTKVGASATFNVVFAGDGKSIGGVIVPNTPRLAA